LRLLLLSDALRESQTARGVADAESNQISVSAFSRDPDFYDLYRTLQVYRAALTQGGPTLVLSPESELLKYFAQAPKLRKPAVVSPPPAVEPKP
jgi:modulator of FtsH protease HflC